MTIEKMQELYNNLVKASVGYVVFQRRDNTEMVRQEIALIQEFVTWVMKESSSEMEQDLYEAMCRDLLTILQDLLTALEQDDKVLMYDTLEYGFIPYLECFLENSREGVENNDSV